ncbi:Glyoxalase/Bleomycin resistance protein/Dioxygenase superfamily protein [compost metagenome]
MDLHFAIKVKSIEAIHEWQDRLQERGVKCDGPVDHGVCTSLYFHDPNGYRLEFITYSVENAEAWEHHKRDAHKSLKAWSKIKAQPAIALKG